MDTRTYRLGHQLGGRWTAYSQPAVFVEIDGRLIAGMPDSNPALLAGLIECLQPPLHLLYVLHTPRGEGRAGRYQSEAINREQVRDFLRRFAPFLSGDGRFDLWVHSPADSATLVWDRHDCLYGYGPVERYAAHLAALGFERGQPIVPVPHEHHYRKKLDGMATELMSAFDWTFSPLQPQDEQ